MSELLQGDCLIRLKELKDNSIDAIITDPPYELGFMGKKWDNSGIAYNVEMWKECLRVLKPDGILIFKWCEYDIPLKDILELTPVKPLFGHKSGKQQKTHWITFMK